MSSIVKVCTLALAAVHVHERTRESVDFFGYVCLFPVNYLLMYITPSLLKSQWQMAYLLV